MRVMWERLTSDLEVSPFLLFLNMARITLQFVSSFIKRTLLGMYNYM